MILKQDNCRAMVERLKLLHKNFENVMPKKPEVFLMLYTFVLRTATYA